MRTKAKSTICHAFWRYSKLQSDLGIHCEVQAKIAELHKKATKGRTVFGLLCCEAVFRPRKAVGKCLQSVQEFKCIHLLKEATLILQKKRAMEDIWAKAKAFASANNLTLPPQYIYLG